MDFATKFVKEAEKQIFHSVQALISEKLATIRHPETGEFPTVVILGSSLENMTAHIEGSPELLEIVNQRLSQDENYDDIKEYVVAIMDNQPKAFFCYATEDTAIAEKIVHEMQVKGIDTWWDKWCMKAGDSLRQKIDEGIGTCTHFIVLLTPHSIKKPWVNQEMDAGLVRKLNSQCQFIPLRHNLSAEELPPLFSGMYSPEIDDFGKDIPILINDIHGVTRKPSLGTPPEVVQEAKEKQSGYSAAAMAVAKVFVENSKHAVLADIQYMIKDLQELTGLSEEDIEDALYELSGMVRKNVDRVLAEDELYASFDKYWKDWNPEEDALKIAADLVNDDNFPNHVAQIAERYGWEPRRINSALAYLINRNLIRNRKVMGCRPWLTPNAIKTADTRRFVKSR